MSDSAAGSGKSKRPKKGKTSGKGKRSAPGKAARAVPAADVEDLLGSPDLADEWHGDQRGVDGDDRHLDEDRPYDPYDGSPLEPGRTTETGNRGRLLLEFFPGPDQMPMYRVVDGAAATRAAEETSHARERRLLLDSLGDVLAEVQRGSILAPTAAEGHHLLVATTEQELADLAADHTEQADGRPVLQRDFLSRLQRDRIGFPWGDIELAQMLQANKGRAPASELTEAWGAVTRCYRSGGTQADAKRVLADVWGLSAETNKKYASDFQALFRHQEKVSAWAWAATDVDHLRVQVEALLGGPLKNSWLYRPLLDGMLDEPDR